MQVRYSDSSNEERVYLPVREDLMPLYREITSIDFDKYQHIINDMVENHNIGQFEQIYQRLNKFEIGRITNEVFVDLLDEVVDNGDDIDEDLYMYIVILYNGTIQDFSYDELEILNKLNSNAIKYITKKFASRQKYYPLLEASLNDLDTRYLTHSWTLIEPDYYYVSGELEDSIIRFRQLFAIIFEFELKRLNFEALKKLLHEIIRDMIHTKKEIDVANEDLDEDEQISYEILNFNGDMIKKILSIFSSNNITIGLGEFLSNDDNDDLVSEILISYVNHR